jgi:hypothetical protein
MTIGKNFAPILPLHTQVPPPLKTLAKPPPVLRVDLEVLENWGFLFGWHLWGGG